MIAVGGAGKIAQAGKAVIKGASGASAIARFTKGGAGFSDAVAAAKQGASLSGRTAAIAESAKAVAQTTVHQAEQATVHQAQKSLARDIDLRVKPKGYETPPKDLPGVGPYKDVGGHHLHGQASFTGHPNYQPKEALSVGNEFMNQSGIRHKKITEAQRRLFMEFGKSGAPNTMRAHTQIHLEAFIEGGAPKDLARDLMAKSLNGLRNQGVRHPTNIPWYTAITKNKGD